MHDRIDVAVAAVTPDDLVEIEAIQRVKHRYLRLIDTKQWDELATVFAPDATSSYSDGKYSHDGRDAIVAYLRKAMASPDMLTSHKVHQPEIELTGPDTATAIWALDDVVLVLKYNVTVRGASFYHDRFVKLDGQWFIKHIGYQRVFEEMQPRAADITVTSRMDFGSDPA